MTNSDWWATVKQPVQPKAVPARETGRVLTLHKGTHEAALDLRTVPAIGHELILSVDGEWRRMRVFRRQQPLELVDAIAATEASLTARGWEAGRP